LNFIAVARAKAGKAKALHVYEPNTAERWLDRAETMQLTGVSEPLLPRER